MGYIVFDTIKRTFSKECDIEKKIKRQRLVYIHHSACKLRSFLKLKKFAQTATIEVCSTSYGQDLFYQLALSDLKKVGINSLKFNTNEYSPNEGVVTINVENYWEDTCGCKQEGYRNLDFDWFMNDEGNLIIHKNWNLVYHH
jgi:hypothetical protein